MPAAPAAPSSSKQRSSILTFLPSMALCVCVFLSFFMIALSFSFHPRTEDIDSMAQLELLKSQARQASADLGLSIRTMTNLTLSNGNPPAEAWIDLYWVRKLHMGQLPVVTWLTIAPLQVSSSLRGSLPRAHRILGYVFFASSASICLGLVLLVSTGRVFGYPRWVALLLNVLKLGYFATSLVMAFGFAVRRKLPQHRRWIVRHLAMGYTVSLQRVVLFLVGPMLHACGWVTVATIQDKQAWYNATTIVSTALPVFLVEISLYSSIRKQQLRTGVKKQE